MASAGARVFLLDRDSVLVAGDSAMAEPSSLEPLDRRALSSVGGHCEYGGCRDIYLCRQDPVSELRRWHHVGARLHLLSVSRGNHRGTSGGWNSKAGSSAAAGDRPGSNPTHPRISKDLRSTPNPAVGRGAAMEI